jgi:hypothetical protein
MKIAEVWIFHSTSISCMTPLAPPRNKSIAPQICCQAPSNPSLSRTEAPPCPLVGFQSAKVFKAPKSCLGSLSALYLGPSRIEGTAMLTDSTAVNCIGDL